LNAVSRRTRGAGSTGSRLVTGTTALHGELETELAAFVGAQAALVFSSGYLANLGVVTALSGPGTLIVSDAANHASLVDKLPALRILDALGQRFLGVFVEHRHRDLGDDRACVDAGVHEEQRGTGDLHAVLQRVSGSVNPRKPGQQ